MLNTPRNQRKRKIKRFGIFLIALYIMIGSALYLFQEKLLFMPTTLPQDHVYEFKHDFKEYFLETEDDAIINTLHFKAENAKGAILYFHGNAGDLQRWGTIVSYFVDLGYDVYVMDYRTYGKSIGTLNELAFYKDALQCYNHLNQFWKSENITIYGRSLGSAMATNIASKKEHKQLILETPFYNVEDVARHRFPIFPVKRLLKYRFPNNEHIKNITSKITIFHGTDDYVVPYSSASKLYEVSPKNSTTFITINGGGHNNLIDFESYRIKVEELLKY